MLRLGKLSALKNRKIGITGANGFIGKNLVETFEFLNIPVTKITGELTELTKDDLAELDTIIHLAAVSTVKRDDTDPLKITRSNVVGTHNLLENAPKCRFVFASSVLVYGSNKSSHEKSPCNPTSLYGQTKLFGEHLVNDYTALGKVSGINLRLCANLGKYSTHGIIHDFIKKLNSSSETFELIGAEPGSIKPYMNVSNTVECILAAVIAEEIGSYNVAPNDSVSVKDIAEITQSILKIEKPIVWTGTSWYGDTNSIRVSNKKWLKFASSYGITIPSSIEQLVEGLQSIC